ncbi:O-antigen ligase family protein [Zobellia galactanivorans]|uniref:Conserved hypothetical membrane protein n=1 Tax=Zobellia galactanivorans (strain DSM 12802 / CCUG 47099 / CIP 106680 / NCIMB 13871 / Dsij) TaxID=63186 RepID=G0LBF7_ZOBGA|nr:O-antigen ligase family protein [Zobellia galactanivorans]CAZ96050.1 Conserved hypothetical membrane protein [Zobellia galactanivorans]
MGKYARYFYFDLDKVHYEHFYLYMLIAAIVALYLVLKSQSKFKLEMFFLSFYLLTGSFNVLLNFKIPGISFFEVQIVRVVYLLLLFRMVRDKVFSGTRFNFVDDKKLPWFVLPLFLYVLFLSLSVLYTGVEKGYVTIIDSVAFILIVFGISSLKDQHSYDIIGKSIIIGAIASSIISLLQLTINPFFLRIGDDRAAFGNFIRSNGIFDTEYFNSYYLIVAITWVLVMVKNKILRAFLVTLFTLGVICSFQRMSWIILFLVIVIYFIFIAKVSLARLLFAAVAGFAIILSLSVFYYQDIMKSSLVQDRLTDSVEGRQEYYSFVLNNIGKKPFLGFGDLKNEVYYENLLRITGKRSRATAEEGDLHSGYFMSMFQYGIPAFVCFLLFVLLPIPYYLRLVKFKIYFMVPFLVSVLYFVGNLTNSFLFLKYLSVLYAIHIGIGMGVRKIETSQLTKITN